VPSGGGTGSASGGIGTGGAATENITERVTSLPALGATIELGDVLYSVDGRPVIAMSGALPAWRGLSSSSDDGADIAQLETSLLALGYDADGKLVVDDEWDSATTTAVKAWQSGLGLEATGEVELGDIVFLASSVTVTALDTTVGADVTEQDHILDVSGASQQVVAEVTDDVQGTVVPGLTVQIGTDAPVEGVVTLMRSVAADDGTITVEVVVTPATPMDGQADGSSVDVEVDVDGPSDAITVPADALVSKLDGSYQVEVRDESGDHWVVVEIIDVRGSKVAISGIDEGTTVLVPA
jgi:peptidoglycan hydrolase-like protein with peptidoglycan-binding domain